MVQVRFKQYDAPYKAGEVVRFPEATAQRLVEAGVAEMVN
jgi:hypothetical protein